VLLSTDDIYFLFNLTYIQCVLTLRWHFVIIPWLCSHADILWWRGSSKVSWVLHHYSGSHSRSNCLTDQCPLPISVRPSEKARSRKIFPQVPTRNGWPDQILPLYISHHHYTVRSLLFQIKNCCSTVLTRQSGPRIHSHRAEKLALHHTLQDISCYVPVFTQYFSIKNVQPAQKISPARIKAQLYYSKKGKIRRNRRKKKEEKKKKKKEKKTQESNLILFILQSEGGERVWAGKLTILKHERHFS
jgi:hypothetical protein